MEVDLGLVLAGVGAMAVVVLAALSVQIVRPIERRLVERFGKYSRTLYPGLSFRIPFIETVRSVNVTECMVDVEPQTVITKDKLNVVVDAVVYYKVNDPQKAAYNVNDFEGQLVSLARTTLRSVIGRMTLAESNENRAQINANVEEVLDKETTDYGVDVLRVEIQSIEPPRDVVEAMNNVVKAEQYKIAATQQALAWQEKAEGEKQAAIKQAEGESKSKLLRADADMRSAIMAAEGQAKAIELVNKAAREHFKDGAETLKRLEVAQASLTGNTKMIVPVGANLVNVITDALGLEKKGLNLNPVNLSNA